MIEEYRREGARMTEATVAARDKYVDRDERGWPLGYSDEAAFTHYLGCVGDVAVFQVRLRETPFDWSVIDLWANKSMARLTAREAFALAAMLRPES